VDGGQLLDAVRVVAAVPARIHQFPGHRPTPPALLGHTEHGEERLVGGDVGRPRSCTVTGSPTAMPTIAPTRSTPEYQALFGSTSRG